MGLEGYKRLGKVILELLLLSYEGAEHEDMPAIPEKGHISQGIGVRDRRFYRLYTRLDRICLNVARDFEGRMRNVGKYDV